MKKTSFLLCCAFIFPITAGFATPEPPPRMSTITSITLTYDLKSASLHVEAVHPSNNWEIDYIRMMTVAVNGQIISTQNYYHQTTAEGFTEDVPVSANVGDVITVDLYCTGGSSMSQDLTVTS
jgi:hypothetical protein